MPKLQLRVFTSEIIKLDEPVDMVISRCITEDMGPRSAVGDLGILPGHMPLQALLGISPLRIISDGTERMMAVFGGIIKVKDNVVTVVTERALWPEEIDRAQVEAFHRDLERAQEAAQDDAELRRNQIALRRALVQMEVSTYPLVGNRFRKEE